MDAARTRLLETPPTTTRRSPGRTEGTSQAASADRATSQAAPIQQMRGREPVASTGNCQPALGQQAGTAQQARGTVLRDPAAIFEHELQINPARKEQYDRLSPSQQAAFRRLAQSQIPEGTVVNTGQPFGGGGYGMVGAMKEPTPEQKAQMQASQARAGLYNLLQDDKLKQVDSRGRTLLNNLERLRATGKQDVLQGALTNTGNPFMAGMQGAPVAVQELQSQMTKERPSEYVARLVDLTSQQKPLPASNEANQASRLFAASTSETEARRQLFQTEIASKPGYRQLSSADQRRLQDSYQASIPSGTTPNWVPFKDFAKPTPEEQQAQQAKMTVLEEQNAARQSRRDLVKLLDEGRLHQRDAHGETLMTNLDQLRHQQFAKEGQHQLDGKVYYREVLGQVATPGKIHQGTRGTCTVTTLEYLQASREPAEYARIMSGLATPDGKVAMRDGNLLTRDQGILAPDDSGRSSASRVYQASVMEYANGNGLNYSNAGQGSHLNARGVAQKDSDGKPRGGLYGDETNRAANSLLEGHFSIHEGTLQGGNRHRITQDIMAAREEGQSVAVSMRWSRTPGERDSNHFLSVDKIEGDYVYLRNPWGAVEMGNQDGATSPVRQALRNQDGLFGPPGDPNLPQGPAGSLRMTRQEFYANLNSYHVQQEDPSLLERAWSVVNPFQGWMNIANALF